MISIVNPISDVCECGSSNFYVDEFSGDTICRECGIVLMSRGIESTTRTFYEDREIAKINFPGSNRRANYLKQEKIMHPPVKLNVPRVWKFTDDTYGQNKIKMETRILCDVLNLPRYVADDAVSWVFKAAKRYKFNNHTTMGCVVVFMIARKHNFPIMRSDLLEHGLPATINFKKLLYKVAINCPEIKIGKEYYQRVIYRVMNELNIPIRLFLEIKENVKNIQNLMNRKGHVLNPLGVLAACIYKVAKKNDHPVRQIDLRNILDVTEMTMRKLFVYI